MQYILAWSLQKPEKSVRFSGMGFTDTYIMWVLGIERDQQMLLTTEPFPQFPHTGF